MTIFETSTTSATACVAKYASRYAEGSNVVVLEPYLAAKYRTSEQVNDALRELENRKASGQ